MIFNVLIKNKKAPTAALWACNTYRQWSMRNLLHSLHLLSSQSYQQYYSHLYGQSDIPFWSKWSEGSHPMYKLIASPSSLSFLACPSTRSPIGATATHNAIDIASVSFLILLVAQSANVPPAEWPRTTTLLLQSTAWHSGECSADISLLHMTSSSLYKACKMSSLVPGQPPPAWPTLRYSIRQTSYPRLCICAVPDLLNQMMYQNKEFNPQITSTGRALRSLFHSYLLHIFSSNNHHEL